MAQAGHGEATGRGVMLCARTLMEKPGRSPKALRGRAGHGQCRQRGGLSSTARERRWWPFPDVSGGIYSENGLLAWRRCALLCRPQLAELPTGDFARIGNEELPACGRRSSCPRLENTYSNQRR